MLRPILLALGLAFTSVAFALPEYPPLDAKGLADFDRQWRRLEARPPNSGARDIWGFFLTAVARNWRPDKWAGVIALAEELHDRDPSSPTYGNYRWYWREPKPNDRNAVEFSMQSASLAWAAYHDRLPPDALAGLASALQLGAEGMVRHKVNVSYTNIFLMRLANCALVGEALSQPKLVDQARTWFDEWFAYTRANGIHEFSSPTYYGTDLTDLGALANFAQDAELRTRARRALQLLWTDIAANWFEPYQGIAGAHSRDYGFLTGHGYLDQQLLRAGWMKGGTQGEAHPAIDDLTFVAPAEELHRQAIDDVPRTVAQRWGDKAWERATHYVGREFTLGSAGAGYGAQDKVLALTLAGGPKMPILAFSLDYRMDPYGQQKMGTADGHSKLTHLLPFIASVQRGAEVLLVAAYDPAHSRNPAGGKTPIEYRGIDANLVLPGDVALSDSRGALPEGPTAAIAPNTVVFLRYRSMAAALMFVGAVNDDGQPAAIAVVRDGTKVGAQRFAARLAAGTPQRPVTAAIWIRATEGIASDSAFDAFRTAALAAAKQARFTAAARVEASIPGLAGPLRIVAEPAHDRRLTLEGADPANDTGILVVNGRDLGAPLLK